MPDVTPLTGGEMDKGSDGCFWETPEPGDEGLPISGAIPVHTPVRP